MCQRTGELSCAAPPGMPPAGGGCTFHGGHAPRCDRKCCRTTGQETEHLKFSPPQRISLRGPKVLRARSAQTLECPAQHGVRHVDKERRERGAAGAGDCVGEAALQFVCPTNIPVCLSPPLHPRSGRCRGGLVLAGGSRAAPPPAWKRRNVGGRSRRDVSAGMSAGDLSSALNFKCHCTKSGDTGWGVNWPSH